MATEPLDFSRRTEPADLPEWMDEPCSYADFHACLADLAQVNRLTLAHRPTLHWLDQLVRRQRPSQPLRIVDVGSGGGDLLRRVERWAARRGVPVQLTGIDLNPYAAQAARAFTPAGSAIEWVTGDAFSCNAPVDIVLSSLFTHHLPTPEVVRFLAWMEGVARRGWFVNDLCREPVPYHLFGALAAAARWHRFVRHDGPVSFRRAFREPDWQRMIASAGIAASDTQVRRWTPARLCVGRIRPTATLV